MNVAAPQIDELDAVRFFAELVRKQSAIVLEDSKAYLIKARLEPIGKVHGCNSLTELAARVRDRSLDKSLINEIVDAMTTNETSFFRDLHPFTLLREKVLPEMIALRESKKTLRIWCAASSSGQEPYTIAMLLKDAFPKLADWKLEFIGTDISPTMIRRCEEAFYSQLEVNRGLPAPFLVKYFTRDGGGWRVREDIRKMVRFQELNLIQPWPVLPVFDIVFLRNVLIYFDMDVKRAILQKMRKTMAPDGYLFLGTAETTFNVDDSFFRLSTGNATCYALTKPATGG